MTQLVAEQMLVVLLAVLKTKRPERPAARRQEVRDATVDQHSNEVVVQRPPRLVVTRHSHLDQAHHVVDHSCSDCERATALVARDDERQLGPREDGGPGGPENMLLPVAERGASAVENLRCCIEGESRVADRLAHDSGGRGSAEVRPQRLTAVATEIVRVIPGKEQHPSAEPILRKHA